MGWQDLNRIADTWDEQPNTPTCRTSNSLQPSIRDYVLACPLALPMVKNFRVLHHDLCPTHSTLQVLVVPKREQVMQHQVRLKKPLGELLDEAFTQRFGTGPGEPPADLAADMEQLRQDESLPDELNVHEVLIKPSSFLQKVAHQAVEEARKTYEGHRKSFHAAAANHMDYTFGVMEPLLKQTLAQQDLSSFWALFWDTVETSTLTFTGTASQEGAHGYRGRGKYPVSLREVKTPSVSLDGADYSFHTPAWLSNLQSHHNRCTHASNNLAMVAKGKLPHHKLDDILKQNANCRTRILSFLEWQLRNADMFTLPPHGDEDAEAGHFLFDPATLIGKLTDNDSCHQP